MNYVDGLGFKSWFGRNFVNIAGVSVVVVKNQLMIWACSACLRDRTMRERILR